jgi:hypothetical protein
MGILRYYLQAYKSWIIIMMTMMIAGIGAERLTQFFLTVPWIGKDAEPFLMGAFFFGILIVGCLLLNRLHNRRPE